MSYGLDPVKFVYAALVINYWPFEGGTSVVVPRCYMLCLYNMVFSKWSAEYQLPIMLHVLFCFVI